MDAKAGQAQVAKDAVHRWASLPDTPTAEVAVGRRTLPTRCSDAPLGFAGGFRRGELAGITVADVKQVAEGLLVHLERSKTDQEGKGRLVEIVYGTDAATCPVRAWRTWLTASGIHRPGVPAG